jgi:16S rRNA (guanine966-N2)-methyltransferase
MTRVRKQANSSAGSIRIIGGSHRGRKLPVLNADGLRPTTDRMKETLFNWLMLDVRGSTCLDCFAGAGSLGFEALSRGASTVTFMELDKLTSKQLLANASLLKYSSNQAVILQGDTLNLLKKCSETLDIVFVDPPFNQGLVQPCIDLLVSQQALKPGAKVYIEKESGENSLLVPTNWRLLKEKSSQQVSVQLFVVE